MNGERTPLSEDHQVTRLRLMCQDHQALAPDNCGHYVRFSDYAQRLAYWQKDSAAGWDKCEKRRQAAAHASADILSIANGLLEDGADRQYVDELRRIALRLKEAV